MKYTALRQITHGAVVDGTNVITVADEGETLELDEASAEALLAIGAVEPCAPKRGRKPAAAEE